MVTSSYPKAPGDTTAPFIEEMARGVVARGHRVDLVLPHHPDLRRPAEDGLRFFPYRYAPGERLALWGYAQSLASDVRVKKLVYALAPLVALSLRRSLAERLREARYDALHVHWVVPNAAMVYDISRSLRVPLTISLHGSDVFLAERLPPAGWLAGRAFRRAGFVTACSADLRERALALGADPARTRSVPYGVDLQAFRPDLDVTGVRALLGVPAGATLVLALGRLVEKKGFAHLVEAAACLRDVHVVIAGQGDLHDELLQQARTRGAAVCLPGNLERGLMARALAAADIVAIPSVVDSAGNVDGLPNTLLEALAAGRPVVASRVAGIPDVLHDGQNGLLVPQKDPVALRAALLRLAGDAHERLRLGRAARDYAVEHLTWAAVARACEEGYVAAAALDAR